MTHKWILTSRQRCDLEMLLTGAFSPLSGFLGQADYDSVLSQSRLADGRLWPLPIVLDVDEAFAALVGAGDAVELLDTDNTLLARLQVSDKWKPDKVWEATQIFGTQDQTHAGVDYLFHHSGEWYLGGSLEQVKQPVHFDYPELRHTPISLKQFFTQAGWKRIVAFQTRNPLHRAHMELTLRAIRAVDGHLLVHPAVGMTKPGDIDHYTRVRCYQKIMPHYAPGKATLSLLPLAMRMAGPRCALAHAIIRKNYGCTHFIVGRSHADPGADSQGNLFYGPYEAHELVSRHQDEIGIRMLAFEEITYVKERKKYALASEIKPGETPLNLSGTQLRDALLNDEPIPDWFSFPEVLEVLHSAFPPRHKRGTTLFFTGLSGAGKTTLAEALRARLLMQGKTNVTLLDGDVARRILAGDLGFSRADRNINIRRLGYVASEITKAGGIALCAAIAPYAAARQENRNLISRYGNYIEIYVATPIGICEKRDTKGLYAKARAGIIQGFTGIDDPYEPPQNPEITIDTSALSPIASVDLIMSYLQKHGYVKASKE